MKFRISDWEYYEHLPYYELMRRWDKSTNCQFQPRQWEIMYWITCGLTNRQIGKKINLEEPTIKWHMSIILKKLGLKSGRQLLAYIFHNLVLNEQSSSSNTQGV